MLVEAKEEFFAVCLIALSQLPLVRSVVFPLFPYGHFGSVFLGLRDRSRDFGVPEYCPAEAAWLVEAA